MTDVFTAHHVIEYPGGYTRSVGPVIGRFLTGLRDGRILAVRLADGRVLVPPTEYDPTTSAQVTADGDHWIEVGPRGTVQSFTWVSQPRAGKHALDKPFAFALIRPDGADTALLHVVDCGSADAIRVGSRVAPRWKAERTGVDHRHRGVGPARRRRGARTGAAATFPPRTNSPSPASRCRSGSSTTSPPGWQRAVT